MKSIQQQREEQMKAATVKPGYITIVTKNGLRFKKVSERRENDVNNR